MIDSDNSHLLDVPKYFGASTPALEIARHAGDDSVLYSVRERIVHTVQCPLKRISGLAVKNFHLGSAIVALHVAR